MSTLDPSVLIVLAIVAVILVAGLAFVWFQPDRRRERELRKTLRLIGAETLTHVVVPDGVDGEIQIDLVALTSRGLLVLEVKRVEGTVFGGVSVDSWTALTPSSRVAFNNPLDLLGRRMVALRTLFGDDVPVDGRVVLVGNVKLGADLPPTVTTPATLLAEFAPAARRPDRAQVSAFYPHWDRLRRQATA